jgi:hypothetical protein
MSENYCVRVWLNPKGSPSTGSVVTFDGVEQGDEKTYSFLELADCRGKIRLHMADYDTKIEYAEKMELLAKTVQKFADHLRTSLDI